MPDQAIGIVVFAHGSGNSRYSARSRYVANVLNQAGLGTLLLDLLTPAEEMDPTAAATTATRVAVPARAGPEPGHPQAGSGRSQRWRAVRPVILRHESGRLAPDGPPSLPG